MSELLKKIIKSQAIREGRFYVKEDGKVYEKIITAEDTFTGYYQDAGGTLYTPEGWEEEKRRQFEEFEAKKKEEIRLAQEERAQEVAKRKGTLRQTTIERGRKKKNYTKLVVGITAIFIMLGVLGYGFWERNKAEPTIIATADELEEVETPIELFGNALITGDEVNLRLGPSTDTDIITSFGKRGERVEIIPQDSIVPKWEKILREDGTRGWVYDLYIKKLDTQE